MSRLFSFVFDNPLGKLAAAIAGLAALVVAFAWDQRAIGQQTAVSRQEKADNVARNRTKAAATKSADPHARGVQDPNAVER